MEPTPYQRFIEYLKTQGTRLTLERGVVADEALKSVMPFTAEGLLERLGPRTEGIRVSRSTAYRTLSEMVNAKVLRQTYRRDHIDFYESNE